MSCLKSFGYGLKVDRNTNKSTHGFCKLPIKVQPWASNALESDILQSNELIKH